MKAFFSFFFFFDVELKENEGNQVTYSFQL